MRPARVPNPVGPRDHVVGVALAAAYVAWLLITARTLGFARDEGFYFHAAADYARWFELLVTGGRRALERGAIDGVWATNHEHPSLMKSLFAISWALFNQKWHLFAQPSMAFRFPGMLLGGVALWVTYLFGARTWSRRAGLIAALLLALLPRAFYHAHLACFDVPVMAMWTLCLYVYWRSLEQGSLGWALLAGVVYGLTLETKHNAWILPAVIAPHLLIAHGKPIFQALSRGRISLPLNVLSMATVGPAVFVALWPWLWNDTLPRMQEYVNFHMNHDYYNIEFLGRNYFYAPSPRAYAPVMIIATVPTITLLLAFIGGGDALSRGATALRRWLTGILPEQQARWKTELLFALAIAAALAPWLLSSKTPIFGGTKHWLPAYPFLCLFAGLGFDRAATAITRALGDRVRGRERALEAALAATVLGAPLAETAHSHPFGLSAYVPLVGGTAGGADLGLNRQFWGFTTQSANEYLAANARNGAAVFIHDTAWDSWNHMLDEKRVRPDLRGTGSPSEAEFSLVQHELHMNEVDHGIWVAYRTVAPAHVVTQDGVPIVSIYRRK